MPERLGNLLYWVGCAVAGLVLCGCAVQRAIEARDARDRMVGLSREQVLACMGAPASRATEGATEVWAYNSGNGYSATSSFGSSNTNVSVSGGPNAATAQGSTFSSGTAISRQRFCTVNIVMTNGAVSRVNYSGPTGGILTGGEQCAYAVQNCGQ